MKKFMTMMAIGAACSLSASAQDESKPSIKEIMEGPSKSSQHLLNPAMQLYYAIKDSVYLSRSETYKYASHEVTLTQTYKGKNALPKNLHPSTWPLIDYPQQVNEGSVTFQNNKSYIFEKDEKGKFHIYGAAKENGKDTSLQKKKQIATAPNLEQAFLLIYRKPEIE